MAVSKPVPRGLCSSAQMVASGGTVSNFASKTKVIRSKVSHLCKGQRAQYCSKNGQTFMTSMEGLWLTSSPSTGSPYNFQEK